MLDASLPTPQPRARARQPAGRTIAAALGMLSAAQVAARWKSRVRPRPRRLPIQDKALSGSGLIFGHNLSLSQFQGSLVQISMAPCQLVPATLMQRSCPNVRPDPGFDRGFLRVARHHA
jgi:hypothetical protein